MLQHRAPWPWESVNKMYSPAGPSAQSSFSPTSQTACHVAPGIFFYCLLSIITKAQWSRSTTTALSLYHSQWATTRSRQTLAGTRFLIFSPKSTLRQETCFTAPPQHSDPGIVTLPLFVWLCTLTGLLRQGWMYESVKI